MVRATHARVLVRLGGTRPTGWTEAAVDSLCTQADYKIDGYTYPDTISTTDNAAIEVAVDVVLRMMRQSDMLRRSTGAISGEGMTYTEIVILTDEIKDILDSLKSSSNIGVTTLDQVG